MTVGPVAPVWLLARAPSIVPIPGTRHLSRLDESIGATEVEPTAVDLTELDEASTQVTVVGGRYPEAMQRMINR